MKLIWIFIFGIAVTSAKGQLGSTPDQCDQKFGVSHPLKEAVGNWTFSREYTQSNFIVTVRFITLSSGTKVAGWISYTPTANLKDSAAERTRIREAASGSWAPVEEVTITKDMDPHMLELAKVHNQFNANTRATFTTVTGWNVMHCWISPTDYAADNGVSLILFSETYLKQFKQKMSQPPNVLPSN